MCINRGQFDLMLINRGQPIVLIKLRIFHLLAYSTSFIIDVDRLPYSHIYFLSRVIKNHVTEHLNLTKTVSLYC